MTDSWEDKKKKKKPIPLIALICLLLVLGGIFIHNNFDTFVKKKEKDVSDVKIIREAEQKDKTAALEKTGKKVKKREKIAAKKKPSIAKSQTQDSANVLEKSPGSMFSVHIPSVQCALADKKGLFIHIALKFYFKDEVLNDEILFKRDDIKVMVKKVFMKKQLSEIVVDALRAELKKEVNSLLKQGQIEDVEFLDFRPFKDR